MSSLNLREPCLRLSLLSPSFFVRKVKEVPADFLKKFVEASTEEVFAISRTPEEITLIGQCADDDPEAEWKCIKIAGPMPFGLTGVVCDFTTPLKKAECPVFVTSTWNTDYVLVPKEKAVKAVCALKGAGWIFDCTVHDL